MDEWCARLRAEGVEFVKEPTDNPPYRIYNAFVRDPNGYVIEIQRSRGPRIIAARYMTSLPRRRNRRPKKQIDLKAIYNRLFSTLPDCSPRK